MDHMGYGLYRSWLLAWLCMGCLASRSYQVKATTQISPDQWSQLTRCAHQQQQYTMAHGQELLIWSQEGQHVIWQQQPHEVVQTTIVLEQDSDPFQWHGQLVAQQQLVERLLVCSKEQAEWVQTVAHGKVGISSAPVQQGDVIVSQGQRGHSTRAQGTQEEDSQRIVSVDSALISPSISPSQSPSLESDPKFVCRQAKGIMPTALICQLER